MPADSPFVGASEMARLMRACDWSQTPLGSPATWPRSLQTIVRVLLTSRFAMWMGWGPQLTFFYNDAYGAMTLGAKHPWALARPSQDVWAEIWPQIGPRIERVLATGDATWDEALLLFLERSGYPEETYHTFSYSPLADDDGTIRGLLCVVTEDTDRVIGERRLAALRQVATAIASTHTEAELGISVAESLTAHARDLPFGLAYLIDRGGDRPRLWSASGVAADAPITQVDWPFTRVLESETPLLLDLPADLAVPTGPWQQAPSRVMLVPIAAQGQAAPAGVFVAGVNPFRAVDDAYWSFVKLLVGQIAGGLGSVRTYEAERRRAEALAEIDRAKTLFFSNVSHEFRTPLTLLLGPIEDALADSPRRLEGPALDTTYRNALRLLKLVNALLDFARIEAGRIRAQFSPTDLTAETIEFASAFRAAIERAGLTFRLDCEPLPAPVFVDRDMWEKIVLNLLSNALKFTFDGEIAVTLRARDEHAELTVRDSGIGIAADELPRLFERFHRVEGARARTHEGSGIGLALVHDLVQLHGGTIVATSEPGHGTTFTVAIPFGTAHLPADHVVREPTVAAAAPRTHARAFIEEALRWMPDRVDDRATPGDAPAAAFADCQVLVADDNADMREYIARLLAPVCRVTTVANGREALAALQTDRVDVLVTDVMMPEMDGLELLRAVRGDGRLRGLPVIMLSARSGDEARLEGLEAGADDYLFKPFSARELVARVSTQLELARARRAAATERDRLRSLLLQVPAVVNFLKGPDFVFDFVHPLATKALGGRALLGRPLLDAVPEHEGQPFIDMVRRVYETGEPYEAREVLARLDRSNSGTLEDSYWNVTYVPVRNAAGAIEGVMTFDIDVTEQVRARRQVEEQTAALVAAREQAESATRAKDEFLAMLGHELRNPLAPILTALELMRLRGMASREQDVIRRQVGHLTRLVDDLLDVSRITRGKLDLTLKPQELAGVLARAMELASPLLEQRRHRLVIDVAPHGLGVRADADRLAQVIVNLLTNAAKYSDPESTIAVRAARHHDTVELRVRDAGVGIPADMIDRIFHPFVQQAQTIDRSRGGLGLGLTIVRSLVEKHGGTVEATSPGLGEGSEFVVRLPFAPAPVTRELAPAPDPATLDPRTERVLVVDDNEDAVEMLQAALEQLGYTVAVANDGPTALEQARTFKPDIALLDIGLPVMDGYEVAQRLRAEVPNDLMLIAVTGYGQEHDRQRSQKAGFANHLVKPIELAQLQDALARG